MSGIKIKDPVIEKLWESCKNKVTALEIAQSVGCSQAMVTMVLSLQSRKDRLGIATAATRLLSEWTKDKKLINFKINKVIDEATFKDISFLDESALELVLTRFIKDVNSPDSSFIDNYWGSWGACDIVFPSSCYDAAIEKLKSTPFILAEAAGHLVIERSNQDADAEILKLIIPDLDLEQVFVFADKVNNNIV